MEIGFLPRVTVLTWRRKWLIWLPAATILSNTGSVGLALIYWVIGFIMAIAGFSTYLEFASYFPNRSGAEVVYLEQAYPRPKHLFPIAFAVQSVLLSFSASNAIGKIGWILPLSEMCC